MNVEHRTPNIERRILMTLRFVDIKTREQYKSLLKSFIRDRFVPVQRVGFSSKSAQVFASFCFYLNFLCSATFF